MERYERQQNAFASAGHGTAEAALHRSKVLIVGAGGTGSPVLMYLAASGLRRVDVCDFDKVEESNLHRQILYADEDIGSYKAAIARKRAAALGCDSSAFLEPFETSPPSGPYDLVIDCTDRWAAHDAVIHHYITLGVPVVHGAIYGLIGHVMTFRRGHPCWRCMFPAKPEPGPGAPKGTLGPVCGVIGSLMAMEAVRQLTGLPGGLERSYLLYHAFQGTLNTFERTANPKCEHCVL